MTAGGLFCIVLTVKKKTGGGGGGGGAGIEGSPSLVFNLYRVCTCSNRFCSRAGLPDLARPICISVSAALLV